MNADSFSFCIQRNYDVSLPHNNIPDALCQVAKTHAAIAMPDGEEFRPEGAIVNYFGLGTIVNLGFAFLGLVFKRCFC